jgi:hypothetical protein
MISQVQESTETHENAPQDKAIQSAKSPLPGKQKICTVIYFKVQEFHKGTNTRQQTNK